MNNDHRLSHQPSKFVPQIDVLDELQLSPGTAPGSKKYLDWYWTPDESQHVTSVRQKADEFWKKMGDRKNCPDEIKDEMRVLIHDFLAYDHGDTEPHRLLNKIADFGSLSDCDTVGVKRGTPLAKAPGKGGGVILASKVKPLIAVRSNKIGSHMLTVVNPETPYSKALPDGIKCARVYRFIGTAAPTKPSQYESIGNAKRGLFESKLEGLEPSDDRLFAWYVGRYEDTRGEVWGASEPLKVEIYFPVG
jgi:hypothetical protein